MPAKKNEDLVKTILKQREIIELHNRDKAALQLWERMVPDGYDKLSSD